MEEEVVLELQEQMVVRAEVQVVMVQVLEHQDKEIMVELILDLVVVQLLQQVVEVVLHQ